jgi:protein TonB
VATPPLPTAAQLITRSFALASINAELQQRLDSHAKRPRRKYISANTKEYRYAAYMEAWRAKVERIGNLNYPEEARERGLSGNLLLDVALTPDGAVQSITVRRSSGHPVLDAAAVRIVELAAPFAPFPEDIAAEVDVLHVTRTWKFLNNQEFSSR